MKKTKKYKLVRCSVAGMALLGTLLSGSIHQYTSTDIDDDYTLFANELSYLANADIITFTNQELYNIVSAKVDAPLTSNNIKNITSLTIDEELTNNDLSDLKFLPNLRTLKISNNTINCNDLIYNQKLVGITIENCEVSNSDLLPNSIETIIYNNSTILDNTLSIPYNTNYLYLYNTPITNIYFKNPLSLKTLNIKENTYLSLTCLKECSNLNYIKIKYCSSLKDAYILKELPSLKKITLDDYAPIWLDKETLSSLPTSILNNKQRLLEEIESLDNLASNIANDNLSLDEKIEAISLYIINNYYYNETVSNEEETSYELALEYNLFPIETSLSKEDIICINYACLFQALANRLNINSYSISNQSHAWNYVSFSDGYYNLDLTFLDEQSEEDLTNISTEEFTYYKFDNQLNDQEHVNAIYPENESTTYEIGYVNYTNNDNILNKILYNGLIYSYTIDKEKALSSAYKLVILGFISSTAYDLIISSIEHFEKKKCKEVYQKRLNKNK